jgi:hypothetical protein
LYRNRKWLSEHFTCKHTPCPLLSCEYAFFSSLYAYRILCLHRDINWQVCPRCMRVADEAKERSEAADSVMATHRPYHEGGVCRFPQN